MKSRQVDELGDLAAEPGSREWAIAVRLKLISLVHDRESADKHITPWVEALEKYEGYRRLDKDDGTTFVSVEEFLNTRYPFGLDGKVERENGGYKLRRVGRPGNGENGYNYNVLPNRGTSDNYILARLERDHPDVLVDFEAGQYRSAREAGIAAGFVKDRKRISCYCEVSEVVNMIKRHFTDEQIEQLRGLL